MKTQSSLITCCCLAVWSLAIAPEASFAQVVINSPPTVIPDRFNLNNGEILNVGNGGEIGRNFRANGGSTVNIYGGNVGDYFYAYAGSKVNISGGNVGFRFEAFGSDVNISGGSVGSILKAHGETIVNVTSGRVGSIEARPGSEVHISGGTVGGNLYRSIFASSGSKVKITGGSVGRAFSASEGSDVEMVGGEFQLNGNTFTNASITLNQEDIFTGTLADGSSFVFSPLSGDELKSVTLTQAQLPALDLTPKIVSSPVTNDPSGLRTGQTLTVRAGGELPVNFAVVNATLNVEGGAVGGGVEVVGSRVNISSGSLGTSVNHGPNTTNVFSSGLNALHSVVNISGGILGERSSARLGSVFNISGGIVESKFNAFPGSEVNISGGVFAPDFRAKVGSDVELIGGEFQLNGRVFSGDSITLDIPGGSSQVFTGTLADGSTFVFSPWANPLGDELKGVTLTRVSLPTVDMTPQVISSPVMSDSSGLRAGQTLTLQEGGELRNHFAAIDAVLNIEGGIVGSGLEVVGSTVNISGGEVGSYFQSYSSEVNISGGEISSVLSIHSGSTLNISGGSVDYIRSVTSIDEKITINLYDGALVDGLSAFAGNVINMTGGRVDGAFRVSGSEVEISGGTVGSFVVSGRSVVNITGGNFSNNFSVKYGSVVNISGGNFDGDFSSYSNSISPGNTINLFGKEFSIDGVPLEALEVGEAFTISEFNTTLSGLLTDGSPFSFEVNSFSRNTMLTVTLVVPEPQSLTLLTLGCCWLLSRRRTGLS